jgi:hypothetical protein
MIVKHRIPTDQYAYIEFEEECPSAEQALVRNAELVAAYSDPGLPPREWVPLRRKMFETGQFDPEIEGLSKAQRYFINQCKLAIREINRNEGHNNYEE